MTVFRSTIVQEEIGGSTVRNGSSSSRQRPGDNADSASKDNLLFPRIDVRLSNYRDERVCGGNTCHMFSIRISCISFRTVLLSYGMVYISSQGRVDLNHFTDRFYPPGFFEEHALLSGMHKSTSDTGSSRRESFLDSPNRSDVRTAQKRYTVGIYTRLF